MRSKITKYLIYLLIFSITLGQFGKISLGSGVNLYLHDIITILILVFSKPRKTQSKLLKPILAFSAVSAASLLLASRTMPYTDVLIGSLYLWRWLSYAAVFLIAKQNKPKNLKQALIASGFIIAVTGLLQYILLPDTRFLFTSHWDDHYYRLIGTFFDPNFTGIFLVISLLLLLTSWKKNFYNFLTLFTVSAALVLTYSRASYLSLLAGLFTYSLIKKNYKHILFAVALFILSLPFLPRPGGEGVNLLRTASINARIASTKQTFSLIKQKPILGHGFNTLRYVRNDFISHASAGTDNSLVFLLATTGIIGTLIYLWLLGQMFKLYSNALPPILAATLIHAQFNNTLFFAPVMIWIWLIISDI